jgi:hypothetical protein
MGSLELAVAAFIVITVLCIAWLWITRYKPPVEMWKNFDKPCHCLHPIKCDTFDRCMKNEHS